MIGGLFFPRLGMGIFVSWCFDFLFEGFFGWDGWMKRQILKRIKSS